MRCITSKLPSYFYMFAFPRLPFKSYPPFGYLIVWPIEYLSVFCSYASLPALMCFTVGSCWLVIAFMTDIMSDLTKLNRVCKNARHDAWELKVRFRNIIQSYSEVKELSLALFIAHKSQNHISVNSIEGQFGPLLFKICYLFRLFSDFNETVEYLLFIVFVYAFLHSCCTMLVIESQLVEYIINQIRYDN